MRSCLHCGAVQALSANMSAEQRRDAQIAEMSEGMAQFAKAVAEKEEK